MATRRSLTSPFGIDAPTSPDTFMAGGSPTVPPTAWSLDPGEISPNTFRVGEPDPTNPLPGKTIFTGTAGAGAASAAPPAGAGSSTLPASFGGPLPADQTPPPSVNPHVVYTDPMTSQGLNPNELKAKWEGDASFRNNPMNARVGDILGQYGTVLGTQMDATPAVGGGGGSRGPMPYMDSAQSALIDSGLADLISHHGATPAQDALMKTLTDIISHGGDVDPMIRERSLNMARDAEATAMTGQSNDLRAQLASRGRASTPGVTQGGEVDALTRLTEALAPIYSGQVAGIENTAANTKHESLSNALSMALGLSNAESSNLLGTLGSGTQRQTALSTIALQQLSQDQQWNEFLASYGLEKDKVSAMISQGNIQTLLPFLQLFLQQAQQGAQGYIGAL